MIDAGNLLKELDDALDKVIAKKEPESFLKPIVSPIEDYQKSIRQIQAQFTDAPQFNEEGAYPKFLSCGLLEIKGKNGINMEFLLPKVYPFPPKSLYIEHEKDGQFLREMLMRLLSSAPLVQLEIVLVDALSLGGIFNLARKLLDKDNDFIYQKRILTESKEIEEALKHLYEYLKVNLQEKLAGFRDFAHYNENAKDPLPLKALFLSGVDALSQNVLYYLEKIMRFGSKNGVLSFVNLESEKNNKSAEDLKKHAEFFKDTTSFERLKYLNVEVINDQGIKSQHMKDFADKIKAYYKQKKEVKRELKDLQREKEFWTKSSQHEVVVPVGWDINHKEVCFEIGNEQNHTLICDHSGSGKSNFLHVLIQNLAFYYAPNEVQLFLLDYKEGVEFNAYVADTPLEHARLVSVASSVGFGVSFLSWLCKEMQERADRFKQFNAKDLNNYRKHEKMPRLIVVVDEFQVLFSDNKSTKVVEGHLNTLLKKGRSYGVHLVLATQTMRGTDINPSFKAQIANRIALPMDAEDSSSVLGDDAACELVRPEGIFNNNGGHQKYHTKMSIPKAPDDFKSFLTKIHAEFNQRNLAPIDRKIYNGEIPLKMPNTLKANEMRLHLGKKVDYEQKDLIVEFESNESHLLVVSQDLNARIALMKLFAQNFKTANKELLFYNAEKRLVRELDELKKHHITPMQGSLGSVLDTAMNPNSVLMVDNLNEAKELHDKVGAEKLKSFLEKATDNEQYCVIFVHDYKQIKTNYHLDKLRELLSNHFKQCLAFRCNGENLNAIKSGLPSPSEHNALFIELSKDSRTEFRPFSLQD
ncbi:FtsK/SpoIIIE domain-containing protein [Helicobacter pylori]|uniref:FtsK/SpoIIIE domain-containing protein n=1 Tax=Helicobacter pylori TaxID=210 RepID=UPI0018D1B982|nr:DNA translocase FtsK [Helicobacter pylori]MBH0277748.1 DNA translocase FtsK [Helicobacter pylori]MBH0280663.1 DNA translocase FtsK [Helicobacter pylori]MBH0283692.1 DNA translocase FtsK [Helicobacter pylori]